MTAYRNIQTFILWPWSSTLEAISQEISVLIAAHQCTLSSESPIYSTEFQPFSFTFTVTWSSHLLIRLQRSFRRNVLRHSLYLHRSSLLGVLRHLPVSFSLILLSFSYVVNINTSLLVCNFFPSSCYLLSRMPKHFSQALCVWTLKYSEFRWSPRSKSWVELLQLGDELAPLV